MIAHMSMRWHRRPQAVASVPSMRPLVDFYDARLVCLFCIAAGIVLRLKMGFGQPLWLDEVWTGAIIDQPDLRHLLRAAYSDSNAPAYFVLMYGWSKLFGFSEIALRFPSLVFGIAAPLLIAFCRVPGLSKEARLTWAALLALWLPGIWYSQEARCYTLLLFLCTGQTLAFACMLFRPRVKFACFWAIWSCLALLTHYHAVFVIFAEAAAYLAIRRSLAIHTWKAAFVFMPVAAWGLFHLPRLLEFAKAGLAWHHRLQLDDLPTVLEFLVGTPVAFSALVCIGILALKFGGERKREAASPIWRVVFFSACAAAGLALCLGFLKPTFTPRYLVPVVPGICLAFLLVCDPIKSRWPACYTILLAVCFGGSVLATGRISADMRVYGFDAVARDLVRHDIRHLVFAWDNPTSVGIDPGQLASLPAFAFNRLGHPVSVVPVVLTSSDEPNAELLAAVTLPATAILWMYDVNIHDTVARSSPPRIDRIDPLWQCRNYGKYNIGVVACTLAASKGS